MPEEVAQLARIDHMDDPTDWHTVGIYRVQLNDQENLVG
jgi:hypothetical protein